MATALKGKAPADTKSGHTKILMFGGPGAGKTWAATAFPKPYFIDAEGGASGPQYLNRISKGGGAYLGTADGALDFDTVIGEVRTLATEQHDFLTLIVDSSTKLFQHAIAKEAERLGDKAAFGSEKKPAIAQMRRLIGWLNRIDMNVILNAHAVAEWAGTGNDRQQIGLRPDGYEKLEYELDLVLHIQKHNKGLRTATVTKTRLAGFPDGDRFDLQRNGEDVGYAEFAMRYDKSKIEARVKPLELATAEQVATIARLIEVVKIPETELEKLLTKAGVDTWADLDRPRADAAIKFFMSKVDGKEVV